MVSEPIAKALDDLGYKIPTPIQEQAIPVFLNGSDLAGQALTGTGKTAAFGIPLAELIDPSGESVEAIVLVPTRELAVQVAGELSLIGTHRGLRVAALYGGQSIQLQIRGLASGSSHCGGHSRAGYGSPEPGHVAIGPSPLCHIG